ncbi:ABC transporter thiamine pyrophosphate-binding lipoprotein p37/Cypl [[Mycoplasma] gypis]|uniref:High affinity transport system protein p37 n=1 Tax=[Mycoplasma] gypis TaxID=92404 RepID=A0ABZ2RUM1_9BACT|nr:hypothetical protein [[Mycoplasma] gypis]MBN0919593.1 hypothetical protein [[Mycoplasma] gypis]
MKINKKTLKTFLFSSVSLLALPFVAAQCDVEQEHSDTKSQSPSADEIRKNWDTNINIRYSWANDGWKDKEPEFLDLLKSRFKELKDQNELTKDLPDVNFSLNSLGDSDAVVDILKSNNTDYDVVFTNFLNISEEIKNQSDFSNFKLPFIVSTQTLKFNWTGEKNNEVYTNGLENDPLRQIANRENEKQLATEQFGEYPTWNSKDPKYKWDGSKYEAFYKEPQDVTLFYRGAILISGTDEERNEIIKAWDSKDFDKFISFGLAIGSTTSGGKYKYPIGLLSKHFNKPINEIKEFFSDKIKQQSIKVIQKGAKTALGHNGIHIAFDDEGSFNWTERKNGLFSPDNFPNEKIRVLTVTNPAPYDVAFGRIGLNATEGTLIAQALASLSLTENTFGIYTGYNKFISGSKELLKDILDVQQYTENNIGAKPKLLND